MIAGETVVGVDCRRQVVHDIACWNGDFKGVGVAGGTFEFDGELAGFFGFQKAAGLHSQHARANQQQATGVLGIIRGLERIVKTEGPVGLIEIDDAGLGDAKQRKEPASKSSMGLICRRDLSLCAGVSVRAEARSPMRVSLTSPFNVPDGVQSEFSGALDAVHGRGCWEVRRVLRLRA